MGVFLLVVAICVGGVFNGGPMIRDYGNHVQWSVFIRATWVSFRYVSYVFTDAFQFVRFGRTSISERFNDDGAAK